MRETIDRGRAAVSIVSSLEALAPFHEWSPAVREALATTGWYGGSVASAALEMLRGRFGVDQTTD